MNQDIKSLALKQYVKYFMGWFIVAGILLVVTIGAVALKSGGSKERNNAKAPTEHVYDLADVLTDSEEEDLQRFIEEQEARGAVDIVVVAISQEMGLSNSKWENNMMRFADDFYDQGEFGWNKPHGDGVCLVYNWYEDANGSHKGAWLSSSGKMIDKIGVSEEDDILDALYRHIHTNPYKAYRAAVEEIADHAKSSVVGTGTILFFAGIASLVIALIYAATNLSQAKAKDTTVAGTYVENGKVTLHSKTDQFVRKSVSSHRVSSSSGGGGGGSRGVHRSGGGFSHGGGGRRG